MLVKKIAIKIRAWNRHRNITALLQPCQSNDSHCQSSGGTSQSASLPSVFGGRKHPEEVKRQIQDEAVVAGIVTRAAFVAAW